MFTFVFLVRCVKIDDAHVAILMHDVIILHVAMHYASLVDAFQGLPGFHPSGDVSHD